MKSITDKIKTRRTATAQSQICVSALAIEKLKANDLPKKDVLAVARIAAVMAAKNTSQMIPYCHPIEIDFVQVEFQVVEQEITAVVSVETISKTGVEMEALTAASAATLTIYDMLKCVDQEMKITETVLLSKKGGKTSFQERIPADFKACVIVTSDGTFQGKRKDKSGQIIKERLEEYGIKPSYTVLPDDKEQIQEKLKMLCDEGVQLILTTGGTGLGPRDVTVEATEALGGREVPGIMEAARSYGQSRTPYAMLSRGLAVQVGNSLIVNLPGSSNGVRESLNAIFPAILHGYPMMEGAGH